MSLQELTPEKIEELALIDVAAEVLHDEKQTMEFYQIFDRVTEIKGLSQEEKDSWIAQFYTDINMDGRFLTKGSNVWGLKRWYPVDEFDEDITQKPKKKKKKKKTTKKKEETPVVQEGSEETETLDESIDETASKVTGFDDELIGDDLDDFDFDEDDLDDGEVDDDFDTDEDDVASDDDVTDK
ncbi:DNA-directed RNA polymerase subunit delta [Gracilibacillus halophilus YIM-C55.5]|uniref:Probable DNA-directed RNA polymerase subunit delta n=1 Tax=Gracilibacillus halophilus YIM-C55.5 TaxID=1308866 RepID=N4W9G8_9BACI|nr:DNA-directed RNA polymerase subunit delta [Gracilibacillus halophilus]ENH95899.1 DNA-directed RNA polymerase subunit delta [Gracilibacillus halophilus YIM-C55.5]